MSDYTLIPGAYATVTPAGAYYAATGGTDDAACNILTALLKMPQTPLLEPAILQSIFPQESEADALDLLFRMQEVGWIVGTASPATAPELNMERDVPPLMERLSSEGRALLAESQGFYLANAGFPHEVVEDISALAAEVTSIQHRHRLLIRNNLRSHASGWSAVDAAGNSQIGFWPLQISQHNFVLVIAGSPSFNQKFFTDLVWWLVRRYSGNS
jgi:hypothetical protein